MTTRAISADHELVNTLPPASEGGTNIFSESERMQCVTCGGKVVPVDNAIIYNGKRYGHGIAYCCENFPACDSYVGSHKDGTPLGSVAGKVVREARKKAHAELDLLWRGQGSSKRQSVYAKMANYMGIPRREAHIGMFDETQCESVLHFVKDYKDKEAKSERKKNDRLQKKSAKSIT